MSPASGPNDSNSRCIRQFMPPVKTYRRMFCQGKRCRQQVLPRPLQVLPRKQTPKATFSQPYMCITRTINLSNTQFRYQLVFLYTHMIAECCLWHLLPRQNLRWHLLPRQNMPSASFALRHI